MDNPADVSSIAQLCSGRRIDLPKVAGIYAFWWVGKRETLLNSNRSIVLKGPGGKPVTVRYEDW